MQWINGRVAHRALGFLFLYFFFVGALRFDLSRSKFSFASNSCLLSVEMKLILLMCVRFEEAAAATRRALVQPQHRHNFGGESAANVHRLSRVASPILQLKNLISSRHSCVIPCILCLTYRVGRLQVFQFCPAGRQESFN